MAKINIEGMEFFAHHGCFEEEQKTGTWFQVDLWMEVDAKGAELNDDLNQTVNYAEVYLTVKKQMLLPSKLLENVAHRILCAIHEEYPKVETATVKIQKLNPPLGGKIRAVSVELSQNYNA